ncbi:unnamed protein product, partial [marine sediment metagenome]
LAIHPIPSLNKMITANIGNKKSEKYKLRRWAKVRRYSPFVMFLFAYFIDR